MLETFIGGVRRAHIGYELDDVHLMPTRRSRDEQLVDVSWKLDAYPLPLPIIGSPSDAVVSPQHAATLGELGGLGVLDLEGLWTRHEDPTAVLAELAELEEGPAATARLQEAYAAPIVEELVGRRVEQLKEAGIAAGRFTPQMVERYHKIALEAGLDLLLVHGVAVTAQHVGTEDATPLDLRSFTARYDIPVVVGGVGSSRSALHLMRTGAVGVLVGVATSSVESAGLALGLHVPLASALAEVAGARARYLEESGRYVQVIAAGGLRTGGDLAKAFALGADAAMLGRPLAAASDAPAAGAYWGLDAGHPQLPRSRFERLEPLGTTAQIINGPAHRDDGQTNLIGGLRRAMGLTGVERLAQLREVELVVRS